MPIKLPSDFPAKEILELEDIDVLTHEIADVQDIRPLRVILFNLMPTKIDTEVQIMRLLSRSSIQIDPFFLKTSSYTPKHNSDHLERFYHEFAELENEYFDAIIITGAPVEQLEFEDVEYFNEFASIAAWSKTHVFASLYICWGAQAGLYLDYDVKKTLMNVKLFGIYPHHITTNHPFTRGFDDSVMIPQSRHTDIDQNKVQDLVEKGELLELISSNSLGQNVLTTPNGRSTYVLGHLEYDLTTLQSEYLRDLEKGLKIDVPKNYYPDDNPSLLPMMSWRAHANLFFINWIDFVYQQTPYDLSTLA